MKPSMMVVDAPTKFIGLSVLDRIHVFTPKGEWDNLARPSAVY